MQTLGILVLCLVHFSASYIQKGILKSDWDIRNEAERVNSRGCVNLTLVLDNWKYAIMTQVKDLLLHDHRTVLPDYGRIQPLSNALGDLYKEFNALKERLGELTAKFDQVETFVDDIRAGRGSELRPAGARAKDGQNSRAEEGGRRSTLRSRVVIRRIKKPARSPE